jgi:hypothetical protein
MNMLPTNSSMSVVIEKLRKAASEDRVFNDIFHVFASRQRARRMVSVAALSQRLIKDGFHHSKEESRRFLKFLASLDLGKLERDRRGNIRALRDVTVSLQSIGLVAVATGKPGELKLFNKRNKFQDLPAKMVKSVESVKPKDQQQQPSTSLTISLNINDKAVPINIPSSLSASEIAELVARLSSNGSEKTH